MNGRVEGQRLRQLDQGDVVVEALPVVAERTVGDDDDSTDPDLLDAVWIRNEDVKSFNQSWALLWEHVS